MESLFLLIPLILLDVCAIHIVPSRTFFPPIPALYKCVLVHHLRGGDVPLAAATIAPFSSAFSSIQAYNPPCMYLEATICMQQRQQHQQMHELVQHQQPQLQQQWQAWLDRQQEQLCELISTSSLPAPPLITSPIDPLVAALTQQLLAYLASSDSAGNALSLQQQIAAVEAMLRVQELQQLLQQDAELHQQQPQPSEISSTAASACSSPVCPFALVEEEMLENESIRSSD